MYVAFVLFGSKPQSKSVLATPTHNGQQNYMPERELPIYLVGCVLDTGSVPDSANTRWRVAGRREKVDPAFASRAFLISLILAMVACTANLFWLLAVKGIGIALRLPLPVVTLELARAACGRTDALLLEPDAEMAQSLMRRLFKNPQEELSILVQRYHDARTRSESFCSSKPPNITPIVALDRRCGISANMFSPVYPAHRPPCRFRFPA